MRDRKRYSRVTDRDKRERQTKRDSDTVIEGRLEYRGRGTTRGTEERYRFAEIKQ